MMRERAGFLLDDLTEDTLVRWIEESLAAGSHRLGGGQQGQVLLYSGNDRKLVIKTPVGRGPRHWLSILMLRHEARVYERLADFPAAPRCFGFLKRRYLVLEYVEGGLARHTNIPDREKFFSSLMTAIKTLHVRGIAHSDLQKQDNLLIRADGSPCLIDFGAAVLRKEGMAPFNHWHFRLACQFDFNQWVKFKYRKRLNEVPEADRRYYRRTPLERMARALKRFGRRLRTGDPDRRYHPPKREE